MRLILCIIFSLLLALPARAEPRQYLLDPETSRVNFIWQMGPDKITGKMPVRTAELILDFKRTSQSRIHVALDVTRTEAGFPFATQALKGPKVLNADSHPDITYTSTNIIRDGTKATIEGMITIRGITQPATLSAELFRQQGTDPGELQKLTIHLHTRLNRQDFGATGWPDMVDDMIEIRIIANINQVN